MIWIYPTQQQSPINLNLWDVAGRWIQERLGSASSQADIRIWSQSLGPCRAAKTIRCARIWFQSPSEALCGSTLYRTAFHVCCVCRYVKVIVPTFQVKSQENRVSQEELSHCPWGGSNSHVTGSHQKRIWAVTARDGWPQSNQGRMHRHRHAPKQATLAKESVFVSWGLWFFLPLGGAMFRFNACCSSALIACSRRMLLGDLARMKRLQSGQILFSWTLAASLNTQALGNHRKAPLSAALYTRTASSNQREAPFVAGIGEGRVRNFFAPNHLYIAGPHPAAAFSKPFTTPDTSPANTHWN